MKHTKTSGQFEKKWEELTFTDNFIFCKVMEDESLCKELLETLLDIKIKKIVYQKTEESIIPDYESKSIRFDVYVKDGSRIFDVEILSKIASLQFLKPRIFDSCSAFVTSASNRHPWRDNSASFRECGNSVFA